MDDRFFLDREFDADIDLTPLIDVVFMLLVFFFTATTFIKPVIEVNLPAAGSAEAAEPGDEMILTITAEGAILHNGQTLAGEDLPALMRRDSGQRLNLHVDRAAPFESFVTVLDEARLNGRENVAITALPRGHE
ncbi:MAG: biopolymer transporter ExbD [Kiritimatiellae bacterium]|nr:biopolymer transporter ExbD [Kiritimatiellia bacterium]